MRALLLTVDESPRGIYLKLSRSHPDFLEALFAVEAPELQSGAVAVKAIAREAGSRSKIAAAAVDQHIDPVGSLVGQRGVRVSTVMSELGGEKIDIIEWSSEPAEFIEDALSPAQVLSVTIAAEPNEESGERGHAIVEVLPDQQSLAIGRGGQNVRLAAKLTGWKIDIVSTHGDQLAEATAEGEVGIAKDTTPTITETVDIPVTEETVEDADEKSDNTPEAFDSAMEEAETTETLEQAKEETK